MRKFLKTLLADRAGATALEYGLIIALIVIVMLVSLNGVANVTIDMWDNVAKNVINA